METEKCLTCSEYNKCKDSHASWIFFIIGLIATIAVRVVTVLMHLNPLYGKIAWYIGIGGFFIFFVYKFKVAQARSRAISERGLVEKIGQGKPLTEEDYSLISAILCGLRSNKEKINYFFIFGLSLIAIIIAVYMDFVK